LALGRLEEAAAGARHLMKIEPENPQTWISLAAVSARLLRQEEALAAYEKAARLKPREPRLLMSIGHVHKTLGKRRESETAYKAALEVEPGLAEAYWTPGHLKTYSCGDPGVAPLQSLPAREAGSGDAQLHFAMG